MKFCEKCGNIIIADVRNGKTGWFCRKCNKFFSDSNASLSSFSEKIKDGDEKIKIVNPDDDYTQYPVANAHCSKCHNTKAYWVLQQTRAADEPQTKFLCCTKCKNKWREY